MVKKNVNVNVICLPTEHQGAQRTRSNVAVHCEIELEFGNIGGTRRKTSRSRVENQHQTQPTYDAVAEDVED